MTDVISQHFSIDSDGLRLVTDRWEPTGANAHRRGMVLLRHGGSQRRHSSTGRGLAGQGWRAIAPDTRGHGDSDRSPNGDYSMDTLIRDLRAVVDYAGEPWVLVGASMGRMTALVGQGEHSDLAPALVLDDIVPRIESGRRRAHHGLHDVRGGRVPLAGERRRGDQGLQPAPQNLLVHRAES